MSERIDRPYSLDLNIMNLLGLSNITICDLFEFQVNKLQQNIAVVSYGRVITYGELNKKANQLAGVLRGNGITADTVVGLMVDRSVDMMVGILGILKSGGAYMPIAPDYPDKRIKYMLEDSGAKVLVSQKHLGSEFGCKTVYLDDAENFTGDYENPQKICGPSNLAYVIYTSGTTGKPKGVMIEHRNVLNLVLGLYKSIYYRYSESLNIALVAPYTFDASIKQIFPSILLGHALFIVPENTRLDGKSLTDFLCEYAINVTDGTPAHLSILINSFSECRILPGTSHYVIGGEALQLPLVKEFLNCFKVSKPIITNVYGPTETTDVTTTYTIESNLIDELKIIPIGAPIENTRVYIVDENGAAVADGMSGELLIAGAGVGRGYLNNPKMTSEKFVPDYFLSYGTIYKTGDIVTRLPCGNIEYTGRKDHQVKIRGFRIELGEVEAAILEHKYITDTAVVVHEDKNNERCLIAYFVSKNKLSRENLVVHISKVLPQYMIPQYFIQIDKLPLTKNGKIDRNALPPTDVKPLAKGVYEAPENDMQARVLKIWQDVLGIESIGIDDNFFEIGGHSLKANILMSKIRKEFSVEMPLRKLFELPTIKMLTNGIENTERIVSFHIGQASEKDYYVLSPSQEWIYLSHSIGDGNIAWNMPGIFLIIGELDIKRFEYTMNELLKRHEILRTSFTMKDGMPVQIINNNIAIDIEVEEAKEAQLELILKDFIKPFDLSKAPLLRVKLVKIETSKYAFLFDIHHIIFDGISVGILMNELSFTYNGKSLPDIKIQFKDYAEWVVDNFKKGLYDSHEKFWLDAFKNEGLPLEMPSDFPRMFSSNIEGDRIVHIIDKEYMNSLKAIALKTKTTLFMILLAAYNVLLQKCTGQTDITVGTLIAGRSHAEVDNVIGMFVNTLPLRNFPEDKKSFIDFLLEIKETCLKAYEHQEYPYESLINKLKIPRRPGRNPLFDTMLILQNFDKTEFEINDLKFVPYGLNLKISALDFVLETREMENGDYKFILGYKTKLYRKETIERLLGNLKKILDIIIEDINVGIDAVQLINIRPELENVLDEEVSFDFYISYD
jgi:fengycin family lipopeptide synthetase D